MLQKYWFEKWPILDWKNWFWQRWWQATFIMPLVCEVKLDQDGAVDNDQVVTETRSEDSIVFFFFIDWEQKCRLWKFREWQWHCFQHLSSNKDGWLILTRDLVKHTMWSKYCLGKQKQTFKMSLPKNRHFSNVY